MAIEAWGDQCLISPQKKEERNHIRSEGKVDFDPTGVRRRRHRRARTHLDHLEKAPATR